MSLTNDQNRQSAPWHMSEKSRPIKNRPAGRRSAGLVTRYQFAAAASQAQPDAATRNLPSTAICLRNAAVSRFRFSDACLTLRPGSCRFFRAGAVTEDQVRDALARWAQIPANRR